MGRRNFGTAGPVSLQRTTAQKEPVEITITDQQRLEAEARLCVGCRPRWVFTPVRDQAQSRKSTDRSPVLCFWRMTSSSWLRAPLHRRGRFVSRLSRTFRKFQRL